MASNRLLAVLAAIIALLLVGLCLLNNSSKVETVPEGTRTVDVWSELAENGGRDFAVYDAVEDHPTVAVWRNGEYVIYCDLKNAEMWYYHAVPRFFGILGEDLVYEGGETHPNLVGELVWIHYPGEATCCQVATDTLGAMTRLNDKLAAKQA